MRVDELKERIDSLERQQQSIKRRLSNLPGWVTDNEAVEAVDIGRRSFLVATAGAFALGSGVGTAAASHGGDNIHGMAFIIGQGDPPDPSSSFFDNKTEYHYRYLDTGSTGIREFYIETGDGSWSQLGGPNNPYAATEFKELTADELVDAYDAIVHAGDDAQSIIENAGQNTTIRLAAGETFDVSDIQFNDGQTIDARGATIRKNANGAIGTISGTITIKGGTWDGNSGSYTGDGLVFNADTAGGPGFVKFDDHGVIKDCAGTAFVTDGGVRMVIDQWEFNNSTWGIDIAINSATDGTRRTEFRRCRVQDNSTGGVLVSSSDAPEDIEFDMDVINNAGPGYEFQSGGNTITMKGSIRTNDGPAIYGKPLPGMTLECVFGGNVKSPSRPSNSNVATIHDEGSSGEGFEALSFIGGTAGGNNDANNEFFRGTNKPFYLYFIGITFSGTYSIEGRAEHFALGEDGLTNLTFNNTDGGVLIESDTSGASLTDGISGATTYLGSRSSVPHNPSGSGDVYIDTSQNPPKWRCDDPTDSAWEDM